MSEVDGWVWVGAGVAGWVASRMGGLAGRVAGGEGRQAPWVGFACVAALPLSQCCCSRIPSSPCAPPNPHPRPTPYPTPPHSTWRSWMGC